MRVLVAVSAAGLLASCTLITSLDGLSGGAFPDDGGTEAASDAAPTDAGNDAADARDAGPFCATQDATLCDDFERITLLGPWEFIESKTGGDMRIEDGRAVVTMKPDLPMGSSANVYRTFPGVSHVIYGYDLTVTTLPDGGSLQINNLLVDQSDSLAFVSLLADIDGIKAADQVFPNGVAGAFRSHKLLRMPVLGQKVRVVFDLDMRVGSTPAYAITFDGDVVYSGTLDPAFYRPGTIDVRAGVVYTQAPSSGVVYAIDNVIVNTNP